MDENPNDPNQPARRGVAATMDWCRACRRQHFVELDSGLCGPCGGWGSDAPRRPTTPPAARRQDPAQAPAPAASSPGKDAATEDGTLARFRADFAASPPEWLVRVYRRHQRAIEALPVTLRAQLKRELVRQVVAADLCTEAQAVARIKREIAEPDSADA